MEYHWEEIRDRAASAFGDSPGGQLEQDLIDALSDDPEYVVRLIERITKTHARKPFNSPWAVIRKDLANRASSTNVTVSSTRSRTALIERGKTWIRNAGAYHATWDEAATELFGDGGETPPLAFLEQIEANTRGAPGRPLYAGLLTKAIAYTAEHGPQPLEPDRSASLYTLRDDQNAREQLLAEWAEHRPRAIQAEADFEAWNAKCAADHQLVLETRRHTAEPETASVAADDDIEF